MESYYSSKSADLEETTRKYNSLLREKNNLESELNAATIKCSELTKSMAELSSSQISLNVQLETTKVSWLPYSICAIYKKGIKKFLDFS